MKKIPQRILPLLLLTFFAAGLLAVPASADGSLEEVELPAYLDDLIGDSAESLLSEAIGFRLTFVDELTCSHTKSIEVIVSHTPIDDSRHYRNETHYLLCRPCEKAKEISSTSSAEPHVYYADRKYVGSNHNGPYSSHTHNYQRTCASCTHAKIESVSANCTAYGCVDPQSLEPPIETLSDDMIFGIYLD